MSIALTAISCQVDLTRQQLQIDERLLDDASRASGHFSVNTRLKWWLYGQLKACWFKVMELKTI